MIAHTADSTAVSTAASSPPPNLKSHIEARYNVSISQTAQLDQNVFKIERHCGQSWVARVFNSNRSFENVEDDAGLLDFLAQHSFPAERRAVAEAVSTMPSGQHVLVTEFVEGRRPRKGEQLFPKLGDLLGRLHSMETGNAKTVARRGGAWHHICSEGAPREEIQAALSMLKEAKVNIPADQIELLGRLQTELEKMDDFDDLPHVFVHPDFVPSNVITSKSGDLVVIDWTGAGIGPRVASLGFLLWAAGHRSMAQVEAVAQGYTKHVSLERGEVARLACAIWFRPLVLRCWEFCNGMKTLEDVVGGVAQMAELADRVASVASKVFLK